MFPKYETIETDYSVGMVWSKEDLIAPFSFPIYKSEQVYQKEVEETKSQVLPIFDVNSAKVSGQINWLDSLNKFFDNLEKVIDYEKSFEKEKSLPEEKRTASEQTLSKMKSDLNLNLTEAEWKSITGSLSSKAEIDAFKKKIIQSLNQIYDKRVIDIPKSQISSKKIAFIKNKVEEKKYKKLLYVTPEILIKILKKMNSRKIVI